MISFLRKSLIGNNGVIMLIKISSIHNFDDQRQCKCKVFRKFLELALWFNEKCDVTYFVFFNRIFKKKCSSKKNFSFLLFQNCPHYCSFYRFHQAKCPSFSPFNKELVLFENCYRVFSDVKNCDLEIFVRMVIVQILKNHLGNIHE